MATVPVYIALRWRGVHIRPQAVHKSLRMAYSSSVLAIQGATKVSLGGAEWTDWREGLRFRAEGLGFGVLGLGWGLGVWGLGFRIWGLGFKIWGLGLGIWTSGFGVWDLGFGVSGFGFGGVRFVPPVSRSQTLLRQSAPRFQRTPKGN